MMARWQFPDASAEVERLRVELEQARKERDGLAVKLDAITTGDWSKARLVKFENGQFDFSGGPIAFIAEYLAQVMEADKGYHNNLEVRVDHPKAGPMVLTLQRVMGKTPAEQRKEAIARANRLQAERDDLAARLQSIQQSERKFTAAKLTEAAKMRKGEAL